MQRFSLHGISFIKEMLISVLSMPSPWSRKRKYSDQDFDIIIYDGISTKETLRVIGAAERARWHVKYIRNLAEKTDIDRLSAPSFVKLVQESISTNGRSIDGKISADIWDDIEQSLQGPEIRTGFLKDGKPVQLKEGQEITISTDYSLKGDENLITMSYKKLPVDLKHGNTIFYYDTFLRKYQERATEKKWKQPLLAYYTQIMDSGVVPVTPYDVSVDALLSPSGVVPMSTAALERM
ncbi:hypothetical protein Taro_047002 [Colocasia esculenta]|uniref:Pyruvate kinase barrel domain-containing protein n=1 Tax=Colocasia esculenta TaxID=4460 RepID=A0A843X4W1_COLES|nr:hypothetical protein [Colocasia esculenta]